MRLKQLVAASLLSATAGASAAEISVSVTNLTYGMYFTPLLVTAHNDSIKLFEIGEMASPALEMMAELGMTDDLAAATLAAGAVNGTLPAQGPMTPGMTATIDSWDTGENDYLSIAGMLLPTNDGFVALNSWLIPETAGTYTITLNAYDAGTEANSEIVGGEEIPDAPFVATHGTGGTGVTMDELNVIHIHRGGLGDDNLEGGISDLDNRVHRWLNPVARVTVVVK